MPRLHINNDAKPVEVVGRVDIDDNALPHNIVARYRINPVTAAVELVWEYISSYIFTSDSYGLQTHDDYAIKCSDQ